VTAARRAKSGEVETGFRRDRAPTMHPDEDPIQSEPRPPASFQDVVRSILSADS